jgi:hypothetical protein
MTDLDWALSVGVRIYPAPELGDLSGCELDATAFHGWVTSPAGGKVDAKRAKLILSSQFSPPFSSATKAKPTVEAVNEFFAELDDIAKENEKCGEGLQVGRRLYLYFAGHGFMPAATEDEVALLMANAARGRLAFHILGRAWANVFYRSGYFREILLFMDCCRNELASTPLNLPFLTAERDPQAKTKGRRFYAYATKWGRTARERKMPGGETRGVFTAALLEGLEGGASDPATKEIKASDLRSFLYQNMAQFLAPEDRENDEIPKEPDVYPSMGEEENFLITVAEPRRYPVSVGYSSCLAGKQVNIRDGEFQIVKSATLEAGAGERSAWPCDLPRGLYLAEIAGGPPAQRFEVKCPPAGEGDGVKHVEF